MTLIQDLHAAISRRDWHAVEVAANRLRDTNLEADNAALTARVKELGTVGYVTTSPTGAEVFQRKPLVPGHGQFGYKQDAVVTRSQADELLAAERAETMRQVKHWSELYKQQHYRAEKAEAIIAAKDAKIADLENELSSFRSSFKEQTSLKSNNAALTARVKELEKADRLVAAALWEKKVEALEAKLTAAEKALEEIASHPSEGRINNRPYAVTWAFLNMREIARAAFEASHGE